MRTLGQPGLVVSGAAATVLDDATIAAMRTTSDVPQLSAMHRAVSHTHHFDGSIFWGTAASSPPTLAIVASAPVNTTHPVRRLASAPMLNGFITWACFDFRLPDDWDPSADIGCYLRYTLGGTAGSSGYDVEWAFRWGIISDKDDYTATTEETEVRSADDVSAGVSNGERIYDLGVVIGGASITTTQRVAITIERDDSGGTSDDYPDHVGLISATLYGNRKIV